MEAIIVDDNGRDLEKGSIGTAIRHASGAEVKQGELIAEWDPHLICGRFGLCSYRDIFEGETFKEQVDEVSGVSGDSESGNLDRRPVMVICDDNGQTVIRRDNPLKNCSSCESRIGH